MDKKKHLGEIYEKYFTDFQINPEYWSLADFDLWASTNIINPQIKHAHQAFYKYLNAILLSDTSTECKFKNARRLINAKKEDIKMVSPLWKNSAVLTMIKCATEVVRAHNELDKITEDRVKGLAFGHKNQRDGDNSGDDVDDDDNPFLVHDNDENLLAKGKTPEIEDDLDEGEESGTPGESATPKKRKPPQSRAPFTPNKRSIGYQQVKQYSHQASLICAFKSTIQYLPEILGCQLAKQISEYIAPNLPPVWTPELASYINRALQSENTDFKKNIQEEIEGDNKVRRFRLYCEKVLTDFYHTVDMNPIMSMNIGERKYIIENIIPIFKFYERTYAHIYFDWIESHTRASKLLKTTSESGIVLVDGKGIRILDHCEVWHMEVSGPPSNPKRSHTVGDVKKALDTDLAILITILTSHLDCSVTLGSRIKVLSTQVIGDRLTLYALNMMEDGRFLATELASATLPFSFAARVRFNGVLKMMAIFNDELEKQESLINDIELNDADVGLKIRDVLKLPKGIKNISSLPDIIDAIPIDDRY